MATGRGPGRARRRHSRRSGLCRSRRMINTTQWVRNTLLKIFCTSGSKGNESTYNFNYAHRLMLRNLFYLPWASMRLSALATTKKKRKSTRSSLIFSTVFPTVMYMCVCVSVFSNARRASRPDHCSDFFPVLKHMCIILRWCNNYAPARIGIYLPAAAQNWLNISSDNQFAPAKRISPLYLPSPGWNSKLKVGRVVRSLGCRFPFKFSHVLLFREK